MKADWRLLAFAAPVLTAVAILAILCLRPANGPANESSAASAVAEPRKMPTAIPRARSVTKDPEPGNEQAVDEFDALTDSWANPDKSKPTLADVEAFTAAFHKLPPKRRMECLQRTLNLLPDENILLVAGILTDKASGNEAITTIFEDVLNRDESVKKPILMQIYGDKKHPCWNDAAWVLEATGEVVNDTKSPL